MSLRFRVLAGLALVLVLSLGVAGALACAQAVRSVRTELGAALSGGLLAATDLAAAAPADGLDPAPLAQRVIAFDGNRHVLARLLDASGRVLASSRVATRPSPPPAWFVWIVDPHLSPRRLAVGAFTVMLTADPTNEAGEVWDSYGDDAIGLGTFCLLAGALTFVTVTRALRPLALLAGAFPRLAAGHWATRVTVTGPPEVARLAAGFNAMAARLQAAEAETRRLHAQVQALQLEERAELARDLHDEIGPLLFAAQLAATAMRDSAAQAAPAALARDAESLQRLIGRMQSDVRALLRRLRGSAVEDLGLEESIAALAAFWRSRYPAVLIEVEVAVPAPLEPALTDALYRCVQEGMANAVRHGQPGRIDVTVRVDPESFVVARIADDGVAGPAAEAPGGLGLLGMRERAAALGGRVTAGASGPQGWVVTVALPLPGAVTAA